MLSDRSDSPIPSSRWSRWHLDRSTDYCISPFFPRSQALKYFNTYISFFYRFRYLICNVVHDASSKSFMNPCNKTFISLRYVCFKRFLQSVRSNFALKFKLTYFFQGKKPTEDSLCFCWHHKCWQNIKSHLGKPGELYCICYPPLQRIKWFPTPILFL